MGISRRFLNLIVDNRITGARSLRCIDLERRKLFNTPPPVALPLMNGNISESEGPEVATPWPSNSKKKMRTIRLPAPSINFQTSDDMYMHCFALTGRKLLWADKSGQIVLLDSEMRQAEYMPYLYNPKRLPLAIYVSPSANAGDDGDGAIIYSMESSPKKEPGDTIQRCHQFEAFVCHGPNLTWQRQILPPPPFICNPKNYVCNSTFPRITSYTVLGGGSHVCLSVERAGTYCLDTVTHTWTQLGEWTLPFKGKVQYVPELKLWFGRCAGKGFELGAADLSAMDMGGMDSPPQLVGTWKELEPPQDWTQIQSPQLVSLGSGRFCIARFFQTLNPMALFVGSNPEEYFTVLTGADIVPCVHYDCNGTAANATSSNGNGSNGKVQLQMISHNSVCHLSGGSEGTIRVVF